MYNTILNNVLCFIRLKIYRNNMLQYYEWDVYVDIILETWTHISNEIICTYIHRFINMNIIK